MRISPQAEKPAITSIQPMAMKRRPDGNAAFLRTADGEPLFEHQPYHREITIIDGRDLEEPVPQPRRITRILQTLRIGRRRPTASLAAGTFRRAPQH
jgi:hypothetical protein